MPNAARESSALGKAVNGWALNGVTTLQSGRPYDGYDFSGTVGGIYYANFRGDSGAGDADQTGHDGEGCGVAGDHRHRSQQAAIEHKRVLRPADSWGNAGDAVHDGQWGPDLRQPGDGFGATGRNIFRGPFQQRFDVSAVKVTKIGERVSMKFQADILNVFNHPSFDAPVNNISRYSVTNGVPAVRTPPATFGFIQHTLGGPRTMQFALHINWRDQVFVLLRKIAPLRSWLRSESRASAVSR